MKTTLEFIAAVKAKHGIESDYAAAKLLGVTRTTLSHYRNGKGLLGDDAALKVAELLEIEPGYVLACIAAERSKNERVKAAWAWWADHKALAAALAVLVILPTSTLPQWDGFNLAFAGLALPETSSGILYIMSNVIPGYWLPLIPLLALAWYYSPPRTSRKDG